MWNDHETNTDEGILQEMEALHLCDQATLSPPLCNDRRLETEPRSVLAKATPSRHSLLLSRVLS